MSINADAWFKTHFDPKVRQTYKDEGFNLIKTISPPDKIVGRKAVWRVMGHSKARPYVRGQDLTPSNIAMSTVEKDIQDFYDADYIYRKDIEKTGDSELDKVTATLGMALGRQSDDLIMSELKTSASTAAGKMVTETTNGMTAGAMVGMVQLADRLLLPRDGNRFCAVPSSLWAQMSVKKIFSSKDYTEQVVLSKGLTAVRWNTVNWFLLPDELFGINPETNESDNGVGNKIVDVFLWHRDCMGFAYTEELNNDYQWQLTKEATFVRTMMSGCAKTILPDGIVRGRFKFDAPILDN